MKPIASISLALSLLPLSSLSAEKQPLESLPLNPEEFTTPPARSMPGILWFWSQTEMTDAVIQEQMQEMKDAGFSGIMMFPLQYEPKFYSEHFFERFGVVLDEAEKRGMSVWMTVDSHIPTGHGDLKVVGGGKVNDEVTLEPREDLRAQYLLHAPKAITGGSSFNLHEEFPGISNLAPTATYYNGKLQIRKIDFMILNEGSEWSDYTFKTELTANNWAGNPLITAGYIDNAVLFRTDKKSQSGYAWSLADRSELGMSVPVLRKRILKDGKVIANLPSVKLDALVHGEDYELEIRAVGNRIETFVNGKSVDVTTDDTYKSGTIGVYVPHPARSIYDTLTVLDPAGKQLFIETFESPTGWLRWAPEASVEDVFAVSAIKKTDGKLDGTQIIDLSKHFVEKTPWEAPAGDWQLHYFMKRYDKSMPYEYPDLFNDEAVQRHIQICYNEIHRRYPQHMTKTFKGFWSDEPHRTDKDVWSDNFEKKLIEQGINTAQTLSAVYNDLGREGRKLRAPYYQQVYEGWTEPFAKFQGEWCRERGLDWMTNPTCDSAPPYGGYTAGNALQMNQWSNAPGVDAIFGQILPGKPSYISRWATSSAHQLDNQYVLYEVYGGYGWDVPPNLVRFVNSYLMVRGANRVSYHAYWTNPEKVGYAPPFDPSSTWWSAQDEINLWNGRLQEVNLGKAISNVALLVPNSTQYAQHLDEPGRVMNSHWGQAYYAIEETQTCFDLLDESNLNDNPIMTYKGAAVESGLQVGEQTYEVIVLPYAQTLSLKAIQTLRATAEKGGKIIAYHTVPIEELDGHDAELEKEVTALFGATPSTTPHQVGKGWSALAMSQDQLKALLAQTDTHVAVVTPTNPKIQILKRRRANATVYLVMNEGEEVTHSTITLEENGTPQVWDPETGERGVSAKYSQAGDKVSLPLTLNPYQTKVIAFLDDSPEAPHLTESTLESTAVTQSGETLIADILTLRTGEHTLQGTYQGQDYASTVTLPALPAQLPVNGDWKITFADQPDKTSTAPLGSWTATRPDYSGSATYTTTFNFPAEAKKEGLKWTLDLGQVHDVADITINGKTLPTLLWGPYLTDLTSHLKVGANAIEIKVSNTLANKHGEHVDSGLVGPVKLVPQHSLKVTLKK